MKLKTTGRVTRSVPVSMPAELESRARNRVQILKPRVSSFSHYIQQLIWKDLENGVKGPFDFGSNCFTLTTE